MPEGGSVASARIAKRWNETLITECLNITYPIVQGPLGGGGSTPSLVSTVSNAGGLGSYGALTLAPGDILNVAAEIRHLTSEPFALNLWVSNYDPGSESPDDDASERVLDLLTPYFKELGMERPAVPKTNIQDFEEQAAAVIEARPAAFSFIFGIPSSKILRTCRDRGIVTMGGATTVDEAITLQQAGVDIVIATGFESGGAKPSFLKPAQESLTGTFALIPQVVDATRLPVIAAGGIADGRGLAAALSLGASGVQIGTAFLACNESGATQLERDSLFQTNARYTVLSRVFAGRLTRSLQNRYFSEMKTYEGRLPGFPTQAMLTGTLREAALAQGRADLLWLWAGQAAPLLRFRKAGELMDALVREADQLSARFWQPQVSSRVRSTQPDVEHASS